MIMLRVSSASPEFLDDCESWVDSGRIEASWRTGDSIRGGRKETSTGFNYALDGDCVGGSPLAAAEQELKRVSAHLKKAIQGGAAAEMDIGLMVASSSTKSITVSPPILALLADIGASLVVSAYPCNDDSDEN